MAVTVDAGVHEQVLAAACEEGVSVSAWMTEAARRALLLRDGLRAVSEWEQEHGPLTSRSSARLAGGSPVMSSPDRGATGVSFVYDAGVFVAADAMTARSGPIIGLGWSWAHPADGHMPTPTRIERI